MWSKNWTWLNLNQYRMKAFCVLTKMLNMHNLLSLIHDKNSCFRVFLLLYSPAEKKNLHCRCHLVPTDSWLFNSTLNHTQRLPIYLTNHINVQQRLSLTKGSRFYGTAWHVTYVQQQPWRCNKRQQWKPMRNLLLQPNKLSIYDKTLKAFLSLLMLL